MKSLALGALLLALACRSGSPPMAPFPFEEATCPGDQDLTLGAVLRDCPPSRTGIMSASAQLYHSYAVERSGVPFTVGVDDEKRIHYVGTTDRRFVTPEGISVGSTLADVRRAGGAAIFPEPGWAAHSTLPSGWHAAFTEGAPRDRSRVAFLFRRD
jgi:hypothetical protein